MKKSIVLVVVLGIMLVIVILSLAAMFVMTQQSRIAEHKIRRMRAFYAAQAGMIYALDQLRQGNNPGGSSKYLGNGILGYPPGGLEARITVGPAGGGINGQQVTVNVDYSP